MSSYKHCITESSADRQRQFEAALLELMEHKNYSQISVQEICDRVGLSRKSFYRYFSSKDGVLYALIDHTLADFFMMPTVGNKSRGTAIGDLDLYFLFWYEKRELLDALHRSGLSGILAERATNFALQEGHMPRQFKKMRPDIQTLAMAFSVTGLMAMILQWHRSGFQVSPDEMTKLATEILTAPLLPR